MDHPAHLSSGSLSPARPWRTAAIVTSAIAVVELLALVLVGLAFIVKPFADRAESNAKSSKAEAAAAQPGVDAKQSGQPLRTSEPTAAQLPRKKTRILVLNGNGVSGAASAMATHIRARRYKVAGVGDAPRADFARNLIMYRPGFLGEATRLGRDIGVRRISPLDGMRGSDLQGAQIVLIIGG